MSWLKTYLGSKDIFKAKRVLVNLPKNAKKALYSLADGETITDEVGVWD